MVQPQRRKRRHLFAESRLLADYLAARYPGQLWFTQLRVGPTRQSALALATDQAEINLARRFNRWADAVVVTPSEVVVIEATMHRAGEKLGKVLEYLALAKRTPELMPYLDRPFRAEIVTGQHDALAQRVIEGQGVSYVHFPPSWIEDFYRIYPARRMRSAFTGEEDEAEL